MVSEDGLFVNEYTQILLLIMLLSKKIWDKYMTGFVNFGNAKRDLDYTYV